MHAVMHVALQARPLHAAPCMQLTQHCIMPSFLSLQRDARAAGRSGTGLEDAGQVRQPRQVGVHKLPRVWVLRGGQAAQRIQLSGNPGLHLWVLGDEVQRKSEGVACGLHACRA
jgi:hypothetical protein